MIRNGAAFRASPGSYPIIVQKIKVPDGSVRLLKEPLEVWVLRNYWRIKAGLRKRRDAGRGGESPASLWKEEL